MDQQDRNNETAPAKASEIAPAAANDTTPCDASASGDGVKGRRHFLTAGIGAIAAGAATATVLASSRPKTSKSRILARIEEELDKEYLNDPLTYTTTAYDMYVKGS